jgi:hypothetical protein
VEELVAIYKPEILLIGTAAVLGVVRRRHAGDLRVLRGHGQLSGEVLVQVMTQAALVVHTLHSDIVE